MVLVVIVVLSLQPNQPGVKQVVVVVVRTSVDVLVPVVVVVSSKHPHQPLLYVRNTKNSQSACVVETYGVLQVSVRVRLLVDVAVEVEEEVGSVPLLSYIFQLPQSLHSGVNLHSGTVSYFMMTS